jgi:uncharacterized protein
MHAVNEAPKPWYREPWPWLLTLAPLAAVGMGVVMVVLAVRTHDGLVADDYYKQGLAINQTLDRERLARTLAIAARLEFAEDRRRVRLVLEQRGAEPAALLLTLAHPTRIGLDQQVLLVPNGPRMYAGALVAPTSGRWHLVLEDDDRTWRISGTWQTEAASAVLGGGDER